MTKKRYKKLMRALLTRMHIDESCKNKKEITALYRSLRDRGCFKEGKPTTSYQAVWDALEPLRKMYGM